MSTLIILFASISMSFWAYCNIFYKLNILKFRAGYLLYTIINWTLIIINLIWIYGLKIGLISFCALFLGGAVIITNFTTNQIYRLLKITPDVALASFIVSIFLLGITTIIKIFI